MAFNNIYRQLHGEIVGETGKAIKFSIYCEERNANRTEWFPLSQIQSIHRMYDPSIERLDVLMVSEWILKQKGWIDYSVTGKLPLATVTQIKPDPQLSELFKPQLSDKLQHPPAPSRVDMDDDIPF